MVGVPDSFAEGLGFNPRPVYFLLFFLYILQLMYIYMLIVIARTRNGFKKPFSSLPLCKYVL